MNNLPLTKERKIFVNNINTWLCNFIIEELRTEHITDPNTIKHTFMGTKNPNNPSPPPYLFEHELIKIDYNFHFENKIFSNDIIIYDMADTEYQEIEYVIKGLKHLRYDQEKILILVSNIMTWARTPPKIRKEDEPFDEEANENDESKNIIPFTEDDKVTRIPSKKFFQYKMLETLAFAAANTNPMLKAYVICPGFLYGYGEDLFYEYFKVYIIC
jgi:hypothetical protein